MIYHKTFSWIAGDDWRYFIQLTDEDGNPYDLDTISEIRWLLHNPWGEIVEHEFLLSRLDVSDGRISIWIPHDQTTFFDAGVWTDWVRIVCNGIVSTLLTGPIAVTADPWRARVAAAPSLASITGFSAAEVVIAIDSRERIKRRLVPRRIRPPEDNDNDLSTLPENATGS